MDPLIVSKAVILVIILTLKYKPTYVRLI